jgi:hypothetical protein
LTIDLPRKLEGIWKLFSTLFSTQPMGEHADIADPPNRTASGCERWVGIALDAVALYKFK